MPIAIYCYGPIFCFFMISFVDCKLQIMIKENDEICYNIYNCEHLGSFDNEPATVALIDDYLERNGYVNDMNKDRLHHEIYMSDARKVAPEKWKTVIRHPIRKV